MGAAAFWTCPVDQGSGTRRDVVTKLRRTARLHGPGKVLLPDMRPAGGGAEIAPRNLLLD